MIQGFYLASEYNLDNNRYTTRQDEDTMREGKYYGGDARIASCLMWEHDNDNTMKSELESTRMTKET